MPVSISITDTTQIVHEIQIYMHTHHIRPPSRLQDIFPGPGESQLGPPKFGLETLRAIMSKGQNMMNLFKKEKVDHASLQTFFHSKPAQNIYIWYGRNWHQHQSTVTGRRVVKSWRADPSSTAQLPRCWIGNVPTKHIQRAPAEWFGLRWVNGGRKFGRQVPLRNSPPSRSGLPQTGDRSRWLCTAEFGDFGLQPSTLGSATIIQYLFESIWGYHGGTKNRPIPCHAVAHFNPTKLATSVAERLQEPEDFEIGGILYSWLVNRWLVIYQR